MKNKIFKYICYSLLLSVLILLFEIFNPRSYHVPPFQRRVNTLYWNLSNGSKIGYTLLKGKGGKRQYPLIYLHGGPGGHIFDKDVQTYQSLADSGYDVYLYDQVGSGHSERLINIQEYTVKRNINRGSG